MVSHTFDPSIKQHFIPRPNGTESKEIQSIIDTLKMQKHVEGGYFVETDRASTRVANPWGETSTATNSNPPTNSTSGTKDGEEEETRATSTTIFYLLTPQQPQGVFHRNRGRTVHTLHWGRGTYVLIHADEAEQGDSGSAEKSARIETFRVGHDIAAGERLQWIVEGGIYKASFLLPDHDEGSTGSARGLLISETVVPGFEYEDHDFLSRARFEELVKNEGMREKLGFVIRGGNIST